MIIKITDDAIDVEVNKRLLAFGAEEEGVVGAEAVAGGMGGLDRVDNERSNCG